MTPLLESIIKYIIYLYLVFAFILYPGYYIFFKKDSYDSYKDCMFEWKMERAFFDETCPGCNDWESDNNRKREQVKMKSCLKFKQTWEDEKY